MRAKNFQNIENFLSTLFTLALGYIIFNYPNEIRSALENLFGIEKNNSLINYITFAAIIILVILFHFALKHIFLWIILNLPIVNNIFSSNINNFRGRWVDIASSTHEASDKKSTAIINVFARTNGLSISGEIFALIEESGNLKIRERIGHFESVTAIVENDTLKYIYKSKIKDQEYNGYAEYKFFSQATFINRKISIIKTFFFLVFIPINGIIKYFSKKFKIKIFKIKISENRPSDTFEGFFFDHATEERAFCNKGIKMSSYDRHIRMRNTINKKDKSIIEKYLNMID